MKGLLDILSWLYISWICDKLVRWIVQAIKHGYQKRIEEEVTVNVIDVETSTTLKEASSDTETPPKDSVPTPPPTSRLFGCFSPKSKSPVFGENTDLSKIHGETEWRNDPNIKDGLSRVDRVIGGNTKVTSYYDETGKLVYQKENQEVKTQPAKEAPFISLDSGEKFKNPAFYIKPQPVTKEPPTLSGYKTKVEEEIDQKFQDVYSNVSGDFTKSVKTQIDEDIDKTFQEVYDLFSPTLL